ncbi:MAG: cyclase family protein [Deltaproteobacteria bacterium]|nr:cyclase family protein [Deltaproteobacteria bacterium]MBW1861042.1 cyclase family protein [Deltaproteobacteria bacterium]
MTGKAFKWFVACSVAVVFTLTMVAMVQAAPTNKTFGNLPAAKMTPYLLSLMKTGNVYDLGTVRSHDMPLWPGHPAFRVLTYNWHSEQDFLHPATFYNELLMCCMHSGTHIDALNHLGEVQPDGSIKLGTETPGKFTTAAKAKEWWGANAGDGSHFHPIILRGVMLDMLKYKGGEDTGGEITMKRGYGITAADIKGCMAAQGIEVKPDVPTAFLIRTGQVKYFLKKDGDKYGGEVAGPNLEAEKYMASIGGVVTGSDTVSYEQMVVLDHPVHRWMMFNGIFMNEVLDLEQMAKDKVYEGVYIALPLKIKGTSGSMIDPIFIN